MTNMWADVFFFAISGLFYKHITMERKQP